MTPLVQGGRKSDQYRLALVAHTVAAAGAGAASGVLLALLGSAVVHDAAADGSAAAVGVVGIALSLAQLRGGRLRGMQVPRQTSKQWRERLGPVGAPIAWGLDLGSGLTTFVPFGSYWVLPLAAVFRANLGYGALLLGLFGLGRALTVVVASLNARDAAAVPEIGVEAPFHAVLARLWTHLEAARRRHGCGVLVVCAALLLHITA
jgi:hypothetical protein